jgi:hypothetical protein
MKIEDIQPATPEDHSLVRWVWKCPSCNGRVVSVKPDNETREECAADPLCRTCRRKEPAK